MGVVFKFNSCNKCGGISLTWQPGKIRDRSLRTTSPTAESLRAPLHPFISPWFDDYTFLRILQVCFWPFDLFVWYIRQQSCNRIKFHLVVVDWWTEGFHWGFKMDFETQVHTALQNGMEGREFLRNIGEFPVNNILPNSRVRRGRGCGLLISCLNFILSILRIISYWHDIHNLYSFSILLMRQYSIINFYFFFLIIFKQDIPFTIICANYEPISTVIWPTFEPKWWTNIIFQSIEYVVSYHNVQND